MDANRKAFSRKKLRKERRINERVRERRCKVMWVKGEKEETREQGSGV